MRVLIVDDNATVRYVTALALRDLGCATAQATNGQEALDSILADPPDLVILDLVMPVLTGYELLDRLVAEPLAAHLPVIVLSAFVAEDDEFDHLPQVKAVLQKPIVSNELRQIVQVLLDEAATAYEPA